MTPLRWLILLILALATVRTAAAQERKVTRRDLPAAVARTVDAQSQGGTIRGFSEEKEDGRTFYEMELRINGRTRDVTMDSSGAVIMVEEEVDLATLPAAVQAALKSAAGAGRITLVESVTKGGQLAFYEAHVNTAGKRTEIKVGPDGKPLD
ncbi:MAG TPA: hypothetical protein VGQ48_04120 [Gemmatimonadales bacterium]|jgi:hypothetical protein|nr:hypothetical protein [Gemmatimonadales bacterium]